MTKIRFIDRQTKKIITEKVYGKFFLELFYRDTIFSKICGAICLPFLAKTSIASRLYGVFQNSRLSRWKVKWFIKAFDVDTSEFEVSPEAFRTFNEFFYRKLKPVTRPIHQNGLVMPADGRYLAYPELTSNDEFMIKGQRFDLDTLVSDSALSVKYDRGSLLIARLCPIDYHRIHFPCDCIPSRPRLINGHYFSVNPIALKKNLSILSENKRMLTTLRTKDYGDILYIEVGSTYVGSIKQTFEPGKFFRKGDEKGYFEFGGSCLILLFEKKRVRFAEDLLTATARDMELYGKMGDSLTS